MRMQFVVAASPAQIGLRKRKKTWSGARVAGEQDAGEQGGIDNHPFLSWLDVFNFQTFSTVTHLKRTGYGDHE